MQVLKWARENNCEWIPHICAAAARGGHLELLKWARENGCEWDPECCEEAAFGGHVEVGAFLTRHTN